MKLSQTQYINPLIKSNEFDSFKVRLQRQSDGFGMLAESIYSVDQTKADHNTAARGRPAAGNFKKSLSSLIAISAEVVHGFSARIRSRYEERKAIQRLLTLSDHHLRDIGIDRADVEALRYTNGSVNDLLAKTRKTVSNIAPKLELIHCDKLNLTNLNNPEPNVEVDRAA